MLSLSLYLPSCRSTFVAFSFLFFSFFDVGNGDLVSSMTSFFFIIFFLKIGGNKWKSKNWGSGKWEREWANDTHARVSVRGGRDH